jgi:hypothetical protein
MYPAGTLTLGNSGLYTGNNTSGLVGAGKASNADEVQIWNGSTLRRYFYKTGSGGNGWRLSSNLKSDASSTQIRNGSSIYVIRKNGRPAFNWKIQQPILGLRLPSRYRSLLFAIEGPPWGVCGNYHDT